MTDIEMMLMQQEGTGPMRHGRFFAYADCCGKEWKFCHCEEKGFLTIGYGHNLDANGLSSDLVVMLLKIGIANAIEAVRYSFSCYDQLSRPRQLVLISMALNLGKAGLAQWPRFIAAVHLGHWDEAAEHLLDSKAAQKQAPERYTQLATMMRTGTSEWV
jgi:lysozyme